MAGEGKAMLFEQPQVCFHIIQSNGLNEDEAQKVGLATAPLCAGH